MFNTHVSPRNLACQFLLQSVNGLFIFIFLFYSSLTQDSLTEIQSSEKEFEIPPTPPPRPIGHTRASSLDLNQLFNAQKNSNSSPGMANRHFF